MNILYGNQTQTKTGSSSFGTQARHKSKVRFFPFPFSLLPFLLICLFLVTSCVQPTEETVTTLNKKWEPGSGTESLALLQSFEFDLATLVYGTETVNAGEVAGTIYIPKDKNEYISEDEEESEAPEITYTLAGGQGSTDNGRFAIDGADLKIADDPLEVGEYAIRIRATDADNTSVEKKFTFRVTLEPPAMKKAPVVLPYFIGDTPTGENQLNVEWDEQRSAVNYEVYISKTDDTAAARQQGTYNSSTTSVVIETFPGEDSKLPDSTRYWVWVKWTNSKGTSDFSPVATRKTFQQVDPWFYEGVDRFPFGEMDGYRFTPTTVEYYFGTAGLGYTGDIVYHEVFDPDDVERYMPNVDGGGNVLRGLPAGVFILRYQEGSAQAGATSPYTAVYYWGRGFERIIDGQTRIYSYIINAWAGASDLATYAEALASFTVEKHSYWFQTAMPYPRLLEDDDWFQN